MDDGRIFILSGPSGSGKDTVLGELFELMPALRFSRSCVTRPMRAGETPDGKYQFLTQSDFLNRLHDGQFLEYNEYMGNYYGTLRDPVDQAIRDGADMVLEIDVNGAAKVRKEIPKAVSVFIMPPSFAVLKRRLSRRGTEPEALVHSRLEEALAEIRRADEYDFIVVNDRLEDAVSDLAAIFRAEGCRCPYKQNLIEEVLRDVESCDW